MKYEGGLKYRYNMSFRLLIEVVRIMDECVKLRPDSVGLWTDYNHIVQ